MDVAAGQLRILRIMEPPAGHPALDLDDRGLDGRECPIQGNQPAQAQSVAAAQPGRQPGIPRFL